MKNDIDALTGKAPDRSKLKTCGRASFVHQEKENQSSIDNVSAEKCNL